MQDAITTTDLIEEVSQRTKYPKYIVKAIANDFLKLTANKLQEENSVRLNFIGVFRVRTMAARKGRNPRTGTIFEIPSKTGVKFHLSNGLKKAYKGEKSSDEGDEWETTSD